MEIRFNPEGPRREIAPAAVTWESRVLQEAIRQVFRRRGEELVGFDVTEWGLLGYYDPIADAACEAAT